MRELPGPVLAGGLAVLAGIAVWRLAIEFERAWMRSYDGPLMGDTFPDGGGDAAPTPVLRPTRGEHRRWVAEHHPRAARRATRAA
ncbi:MAG: hypothetical protein ABSG93_18505 [Solirubrobacteraceae bacterium]|jgi:hypothetical protein